MGTRYGLVVAFAILAPLGGRADITYDAAQHTLRVTGGSEETPGTLQDVLDASNRSGWGVVSYDSASQAFAVNAHLVVGSDDGSSTWFRIGTPERPREALDIAGDLRVTAPSTQPQGRSALWIGEAGNPGITPTLRFWCQKPKQFGLLVAAGAELRINHALLTAGTPDREHTAGCAILSPDAQVADSTFSWMVAVPPAGGLLQLTGPVDRVVFEHGEVAFGNGLQWARDCVFRDMDLAVFDGGCLDAILTRCRFEGNRKDWSLGYTDQGIIATDCTFDREPGSTGAITRWRNPSTGRWQHPRFVALRHIVIRAQDEAGKPVPGALVAVKEAQGDLAAVHHGVAKTDADGATPAPDLSGALLLCDCVFVATDEAPEPDSAACWVASYEGRYTVRVTAEGFQPATLRDSDPDGSWSEKAITLQRL